MKAARQLDIKVHGTFILGLPGETAETMEQTIRFARELDPYSIQVSLAAPYPGTELYDQARQNGWLAGEGDRLVREGIQDSVLSYEDLTAERIFDEVDLFYRRFYFQATTHPPDSPGNADRQGRTSPQESGRGRSSFLSWRDERRWRKAVDVVKRRITMPRYEDQGSDLLSRTSGTGLAKEGEWTRENAHAGRRPCPAGSLVKGVDRQWQNRLDCALFRIIGT